MKNFLEYTYQIVRKSLERYLYQVQQKEQLKHEEQKSQEISKKKAQDQSQKIRLFKLKIIIILFSKRIINLRNWWTSSLLL